MGFLLANVFLAQVAETEFDTATAELSSLTNSIIKKLGFFL